MNITNHSQLTFVDLMLTRSYQISGLMDNHRWFFESKKNWFWLLAITAS